MTPTSNNEVPDFTNAKEQLENFLDSQKLSVPLHWVFREDVLWGDDEIRVKEPLPEGNLVKAQRLYERGLQLNLGVRIEVLCVLNGHPCCYVWIPRNHSDAEENGLLMSKFILSMPTHIRNSKAVRNPIMWWIQRFLKDSSNWIIDRVPSREMIGT